MKESEIQKQIVDYLEAMNFIVLRTNSGQIHIGNRWIMLCKAGTSDLTCMDTRGRFIAIETKRPGKDLTEEQKRYKKRVEDRNGIYIKADCLGDVVTGLCTV